MTRSEEWRVLVVDDDELTCRAVKRVLQLDGYAVSVAHSAVTCLEAARETQPFAVILDRRLEDGTAEELLPSLKEYAPNSAVVIATGFADLESSITALRLGAADYLIKPIEPSRLLEALRRIREQEETVRSLAKVQAELQMSEERMRLVVQATRDAIWDIDLAAGAVWVNDRFAEAFGGRELLPNGSLDWHSGHVHPDDREEVEASLRQTVEGDGERWRCEYRCLRADGSLAYAVDRALISRDASGAAVRVLGAIKDMTSHRQLEAELSQAHKMEAVGRLAGGVAHDFNNLLAGVLSSCRVASALVTSKDDADRASAQELMEMMERRVRRSVSMTRQLLDFSRLRSREIVSVNVTTVLEEAREMLVGLLEDSVQLRIESHAPHSLIQADAGSMEQIIVNLALNGRDAMPDGGGIEFSVSQAELPVHLQREASQESQGAFGSTGQYVVLEVRDHGVGMDEAALQRIFEPFYTTKAPGEGTGLGLSTVFGLVKDFHGVIDVTSEPGHGSTFRLYLPLSGMEPDRTQQAKEPRRAKKGMGTILVVEDEALLRAATKLQLRSAGYDVLDSGSPKEALQVVERGDRKVDLLLSDVVMPEMSGPELAEKLLAQEPRMKTLFMSGYSGEYLAEHGRLVSESQVLEKPFDQEELLERIREELEPRTNRE